MRRNLWSDLNKEERMQLKALICLLGIFLLLLLAAGRLMKVLPPAEEEPGEPVPGPEHIPVVREMENVWILEADEGGLTCYYDGQEQSFPCEEGCVPKEPLRDQVADLVLSDERVSACRVKGERIGGRILSAGPDYVEVEGRGRLPLAENYRGYRLYGALQECSFRDIPIGYDLTDLCVEDGQVCAVLLARKEAMERIRVLIKTSDFEGIFHSQITLTADVPYSVTYGGDNSQTAVYQAGEVLQIDQNSPLLASGRVLIRPQAQTGRIALQSVHRSQGIPAYRGSLELLPWGEGILVINELPLEEYLYSVVPSEMPASYPEQALMAQAVCARTYAYGCLLRAGYGSYGAHVDDSTGYQVYNNILEQPETTAAVKATYGQLLMGGTGEPAQTFYYSTSCGVGSCGPGGGVAISRDSMESGTYTILDLSGEENFRSYIGETRETDYESGESWYRWSYQVTDLDESTLEERLKKRCQANGELILTEGEDGEFVPGPVDSLGELRSVTVAAREADGAASELILRGSSRTYKVLSEYNIRYVLCDGAAKARRQDGSEVSCQSLLPSAFFVLESTQAEGKVTGYTLHGGGFGHGRGMSQNGARAMAVDGYDARQILEFFYGDCRVEPLY